MKNTNKVIATLIAVMLSLTFLLGTTSASADNTETTSIAVLYGDVNVDGTINICDAVSLNRYLVRGEELSPAGIANANLYMEFDGENVIDCQDSLYILKFLIGIVNQLPVINTVPATTTTVATTTTPVVTTTTAVTTTTEVTTTATTTTTTVTESTTTTTVTTAETSEATTTKVTSTTEITTTVNADVALYDRTLVEDDYTDTALTVNLFQTNVSLDEAYELFKTLFEGKTFSYIDKDFLYFTMSDSTTKSYDVVNWKYCGERSAACTNTHLMCTLHSDTVELSIYYCEDDKVYHVEWYIK